MKECITLDKKRVHQEDLSSMEICKAISKIGICEQVI